MRLTVIILCGLSLLSCSETTRQKSQRGNLPNEVFSSEQVTHYLNIAYTYMDSGEFVLANHVYQRLLKATVEKRDRVDIASGYVTLLLRQNQTANIRSYIDEAFPMTDSSSSLQFYRSINFFHVYRIEDKCDSANQELDILYKIVAEQDNPLLSIKDLDQNRYALLNECYNQPDSAHRWFVQRGLHER